MRRRSRLLRIAKWGGVVAFVLLAAALCFSLIWEIGFGFDSGFSVCRLNAGCLYYDDPLRFGEPRWPFGFFCKSRSGPRRWIVPSLNRDDWQTYYAIPLWPGLGLVGLGTVVAFRLDRRPLPGHCPCGYDLRGNVSGTCPECGTPFSRKGEVR